MTASAADTIELRKYCQRRAAAMRDSQNDWVPDWRDSSEYVDPARGRFNTADNRKVRRSRAKVINSKATECLRVMAAGMMSHMTPKAVPWFKVSPPDPSMVESFGVRVWLDEVTARIRDALAGSNFYKAMPVLYTEDGLFGTAPMLVLEDAREVVRFYPLTAGTYAIALDEAGRVNALWRKYSRTADQLNQRYGRDKLPLTVRNALDGGKLDTPFMVESLIEPNPDARPGQGPLGLQAPKHRPYREVVWINANTDDGSGVIDVGGHYEAPFVTARWNPVAEDIYSTAPAIDCLGDIKQLQYLEGEKLNLMEQLSDPTLAVPESLRLKGGARLRKGGQVYLPQDVMGAEVRPIYQPDPRALMQVREEIATIEGRIERAFFYQLFLMMEALGDATGRTATEIAERREEKAAVLGPTLESITDEVLDPVVIRTFRLLERAGRIPPPPEELAGAPLKIEYTSILAQAAKANGTSSIERVIQFAAGVAQATGNTDALDKIDADQAIDEYADRIGSPASMLRDDDAVAQIRAGRAQQQQMAQMAQMAKPIADAAGAMRTLAETVPQEGSAAESMAGALG